MALSAQDRARRIKIILFDVDGVLTDGTIWLVPAASVAVSSPGALARRGGMKCGVITKRVSETVATRSRDLKLEHVYMGQAFKMQAVREIMQKEGVTLEEVAYVGDDVIDLPVMRECGFAVAVANARPQVKAAAHYITPNAGGYGAGRDAVEFILEAKGILDKVIAEYIDERNPISPSMDIGKGGAGGDFQ